MLKRISALLAALFLCAVLSGCSFVMFDAQALMSPPKSNIDQQSIHKLLQGSRQDITFIYPKSGEYRSAIIMRDFTGDGREDAIGFCALEDDSVEVQFLVKSEEDVWKTVFTARNPATQVDRVCFGDLNGDGRSDVLIGWVESAELNETRTAFKVRVRLAAEMSRLTDVILVENRDLTEIRDLQNSEKVEQHTRLN